MAMVETFQQPQRARGLASILAIGTADPPNCVYQADCPDYYFRVIKSKDMTELKEKFKHLSILDKIEAKLGLNPEKFKATKHVLSEYGNIVGASVIFILNKMRKKGHRW